MTAIGNVMRPHRSFISYEERLQRVLSYIYDNIDEDLSLDDLADIACMSRYHWHRVFRAMTGETLATVVRRLRLNKAANMLAQEDASVRQIAEKVGYTNLASFSRAFKSAFGTSPKEFRGQGRMITNELNLRNGVEGMYPIEVKEFRPFRAAGVLHVGPYQQIGKAFGRLGAILTANSLLPKVNDLFAIYHDPPESKPSAQLRSHVAVSVKEDFPEDIESLEYFDVTGGRYAVLEYKGPYSMMQSAYEWLYGTWLPQSGLEPRDDPPIEVYVSDPKTTPAAELRTDIRLPLQ